MKRVTSCLAFKSRATRRKVKMLVVVVSTTVFLCLLISPCRVKVNEICMYLALCPHETQGVLTLVPFLYLLLSDCVNSPRAETRHNASLCLRLSGTVLGI